MRRLRRCVQICFSFKSPTYNRLQHCHVYFVKRRLKQRAKYNNHRQVTVYIFLLFSIPINYLQTKTGTIICVYAKNMTSPTHIFKWLNIWAPSLAVLKKHIPTNTAHITWCIVWIHSAGKKKP